MPVLHCHSSFEGTSYKKLQEVTKFYLVIASLL